MTTLVKITSSPKGTWYEALIGREFQVVKLTEAQAEEKFDWAGLNVSQGAYEVTMGSHTNQAIRVEDAEVTVQPNWKEVNAAFRIRRKQIMDEAEAQVKALAEQMALENNPHQVGDKLKCPTSGKTIKIEKVHVAGTTTEATCVYTGHVLSIHNTPLNEKLSIYQNEL